MNRMNSAIAFLSISFLQRKRFFNPGQPPGYTAMLKGLAATAKYAISQIFLMKYSAEILPCRISRNYLRKT
jgi:hypothetical protein